MSFTFVSPIKIINIIFIIVVVIIFNIIVIVTSTLITVIITTVITTILAITILISTSVIAPFIAVKVIYGLQSLSTVILVLTPCHSRNMPQCMEIFEGKHDKF